MATVKRRRFLCQSGAASHQVSVKLQLSAHIHVTVSLCYYTSKVNALQVSCVDGIDFSVVMYLVFGVLFFWLE